MAQSLFCLTFILEHSTLYRISCRIVSIEVENHNLDSYNCPNYIYNLTNVKLPSYCESMKRFGEKLRYLRKREGYSLRKLGEMIGVYHTYISQIEHGAKPSIEFMVKVADIFHVSLDNLIRDELDVV